ncbi:MAG: DNA gyrase subunit A [Rhodospirillales bacterium]|nr:DNA gyrase subunit A [Rhodospirillales bacterium]
MSDTTTPPFDSDITPVTIESEMKRSYLDYAMSVIVSRALPDVRDGLKPVHRRILYAMKEGGYDWNRAFRKSARITGDVMGKYHPHGNQAIYDAMVRLAQDFSMRLPLISGQGNFGSMDGDPPAAERYTEARLSRAASEALLEDIERETVDFQPNYDEKEQEPVVLPARIPNLLVNGAGGIAVGMATNIPPHNLGEVIDACRAYVENPAISIDELIEIVPGPDFPTGGIILGRRGIREAFHTGRGSIMMRSKTHIEEVRKDREAIIVTEVPYQVNKARMIKHIAHVVREKTVDGILDIRDESDRHGLRVVIEIRRDAVAEVILNQLYRYTPLQTSFGVNMLALVGGKPELLDLKRVVAAFVEFREEVITRRTAFELGKARERAHILVGLAIAVANIDPVIVLIKAAPDPAAARTALLERAWPAAEVEALVSLVDEPGREVAEDGTYRMSEAQAKAILELRLQRLTGLERDKIAEELQELAKRIQGYLEILESRERLLEVLLGELDEMKQRFADPRRTTIEEMAFEPDIEALIQREDMVVTLSHGGYIKRVPLSTYRAQRRGGKGRAGMSTREEDFVRQVFVRDTHTPMLFFSSRGMAYKLKIYTLPKGTPQARGKALVNLLPLQEGETITAVMPMPEDEETWAEMDVMFATSKGTVRRNRLSDFIRVQANGKIAMKLEEEGSWLVGVRTCGEGDDVLMATAKGKCIRFPVADVRVFSGRQSVGVRGIRLAQDDAVISMSILRHTDVTVEERDAYLRYAGARRRAESGDNGEAPCVPEEVGVELDPARIAELEAREQFILSIADDGLGKRTSAYEYRVSGRGGQGVTSMDLSRGRGRETPRVVAAFPIEENDELVLVTDGGQLIRSPVHDIRIAGRATRGVTLFRVGEAERVVSVARLEEDDEAGDNEAGDDEAGDDEAGDDEAGDDEAGDDEAENGAPEGPEGENS